MHCGRTVAFHATTFLICLQKRKDCIEFRSLLSDLNCLPPFTSTRHCSNCTNQTWFLSLLTQLIMMDNQSLLQQESRGKQVGQKRKDYEKEEVNSLTHRSHQLCVPIQLWRADLIAEHVKRRQRKIFHWLLLVHLKVGFVNY